MIFCLFVCLSELIEELVGARNLEIGMKVSNVISTKVFEWIRKIFTPWVSVRVSKCLKILKHFDTLKRRQNVYHYI